MFDYFFIKYVGIEEKPCLEVACITYKIFIMFSFSELKTTLTGKFGDVGLETSANTQL